MRQAYRKLSDNKAAMKLRFLVLFVLAVALFGCKSLKDQQLGAYVGDSQTKIVYKNIGKNTSAVPEARRVYFRSVDDAMGAGYTLSNMADKSGGGTDDQ